MVLLNETEARAIGSLIEKEFTTPEYYPLTLNALVNACSQKSNREPVVQYDDTAISSAIESLREKKFVIRITGADIRVPKYREIFTEHYNFSQEEIAVVAVLLLRGPQTPGEIRTRTGRLHEFANPSEVMAVLDKLISREGDAMAVKLPRQPGKDARYMHLFCGEPVISETPVEVSPNTEARIILLESEISTLRNEIEGLKEQFRDFKKQFE